MRDATHRAAPLSGTDRAAAPSTIRLPRGVESDPGIDEIRQVLAADARRLWVGGALETAVIPLTDAVRSVLTSPAVSPTMLRGLETAEAALAAEQRGLAALEPAVAARQGRRVSRVLLITNDGAERFYRQVERLAISHAPRVLVCMLDVPSADLGGLLYGDGAVAKLVLTGHKDAATSLLRALASAPSPETAR